MVFRAGWRFFCSRGGRGLLDHLWYYVRVETFVVVEDG